MWVSGGHPHLDHLHLGHLHLDYHHFGCCCGTDYNCWPFYCPVAVPGGCGQAAGSAVASFFAAGSEPTCPFAAAGSELTCPFAAAGSEPTCPFAAAGSEPTYPFAAGSGTLCLSTPNPYWCAAPIPCLSYG